MGINVWASQNEKTSFGPVMRSFGALAFEPLNIKPENTLGTIPLKKLVIPSFLSIPLMILNPVSGLSKFRFCIRVLITSRGPDTNNDAEAPATDATKFWCHDALL